MAAQLQCKQMQDPAPMGRQSTKGLWARGCRLKIPETKEEKDLGVVIDEKLRFHQQSAIPAKKSDLSASSHT